MAKATSRLTPPERRAASTSIHSSRSRASISRARGTSTSRLGRAAQLAEQVDRLARREAVDRYLRLRLEGAQPPGQARVGDHVAAVDPDGAGGRPQQTRRPG